LTLGRRLSQTATLYPKRVALVFEGRRYAYKELDEMADGFARGLFALGIAPGCKAAIMLPNCPEFAVAFFGIVKAGGAAVPLNTLLAPAEIDYILKDSGADVLICSALFKDKVRELINVPKHVVVVGDVFDGAVPFYDLVRGLLSPSPQSPPLKGGEINLGPDNADGPAAIFYTSGTTGYPKGAVLTHGNLLSNADSVSKMFRVTIKDRFLLFLPMFHSFSFLVCLLLPLTLGARTIILASIRPFSKVI
jgi:long-chain acyl-CoA synthetase